MAALGSDSKPTPRNMPVAYFECGRLRRRLEREPLAVSKAGGGGIPPSPPYETYRVCEVFLVIYFSMVFYGTFAL